MDALACDLHHYSLERGRITSQKLHVDNTGFEITCNETSVVWSRHGEHVLALSQSA
jgi:hypothetical protein